MTNFIIIIPIYNEEKNLENQILRLSKANLLEKCLFVNDGSSDKSSKILDKHDCRKINHKRNMGVGAALRTGINYSIKNNYKITVIMAGDNQDDPNEISKIISPIEKYNYDFVQGSRYKGKSKHIGIVWKYVSTKIYSLFFSLIATRKITDASNAFRAFKNSFILENDLMNNNYNKYDLEPYLLLKAIKENYKVKEVFVHKYYNKKTGYTKMRPLIDWFFISKPLIRIIIHSIFSK